MLEQILSKISPDKPDNRTAYQRKMDGIPQQKSYRDYVVLYYEKYPFFHVTGERSILDIVSVVVDDIELAPKCYELIMQGYELKIKRIK